MLGLLHERSELGPAAAHLICDVPPGVSDLGAVGLAEGLPDGGGHDGVLALGHSRASSAAPCGALCCVDRCCPNVRLQQAASSEHVLSRFSQMNATALVRCGWKTL